MIGSPENAFHYVTGGNVQAGGGFYIPRQADYELLKLCQEGAFAYVLAPRQVGKSSLMIRTAETLINEGFQSVVIDLNLIGTHTISPDTWYLDFLSILETELALDVDTNKWWQEHSDVGYIRRLTLFFKEILLTEIQGKIIIFIDEIDATLSLDFRDDFFASIRSLYDARAQVEEYRRLSFVLVGVATPSDLIQNPKRTPFNIGKRVDLTDFSYKEAQPLTEGLGLPPAEAAQVLTWILKWTEGHPYLTQRLCNEVQRENRQSWNESELGRVVDRVFLGEKSEQDNNLQFVRDMLTKRAVTVGVAKVLSTYRQVRQGRRQIVDEEKSVVKSHLKITGIVRREAGFLKVRNPIYNKVFDEQWLRENLPVNWSRWLQRIAIAVAVILTFSAISAVIIYLTVQLGTVTEINKNLDKAKQAVEVSNEELKKQKQAVEVSNNELQKQQRVIDSQALALKAQIQSDPEVSLLLAIKAAQQVLDEKLDGASSQVEAALRQAILNSPVKTTELKGNSTIKIISFSPDLKSLFTAESNGTIQVWDFVNNKQLNVLSLNQEISNIYFNLEDGNVYSVYLVTVNKTVFQYDSTLKTQLKEIKLDNVSSVILSADTKSLLTVAPNGIVNLQNWPSRANTIQTFTLKERPSLIALSPDKLLLASVYSSGDVELRNFTSNKPIQTLKGGKGILNNLVFSPDSRYLLGSSNSKEEGTARLWDVTTGRELAQLTGHSGVITGIGYSPDGRYVVTASTDSTSRLWEAITGKELAVLRGSDNAVSAVAFSPNNRLVVSGSDDGVIRIWEAGTGREDIVISDHNTSVSSVAFSPDGKMIASVALTSKDPNNKNLLLSDSKTGKEIRELKFLASQAVCLAFSPDGTILASGNSDGLILLWDVTTGNLKKTINSTSKPVTSISFSPDGKTLASTGGDDKTILIWDLETALQKIAPLTGHSEPLTSISFSPDGTNLASGSADKTVRVWDVKTGKLQQTLAKHTDKVNGVAYSLDGKYLASGSDDRSAILWDLKTGKDLFTLKGHVGAVNSVAFSTDSSLLATTSEDRTTRLWKIRADQADPDPVVLRGHTSPVNSAAFSMDGKNLITGSSDTTIRVYLVQLNDLILVANDRKGRELTSEERALYLSNNAPGVRYELLANPSAATWCSKDVNDANCVALPFPGSDVDNRGFALLRENFALEDNSVPISKVLEMHPKWVTNALIMGIFPSYTVKSGEHFKASVGFLKHPSSQVGQHVLFRVEVVLDNDIFGIARPRIAEVDATYDSKLQEIDIDLANAPQLGSGGNPPTVSFIGRSIRLRLVVIGLNTSSQADWAVWVNPRVEAP